jgi:hypothetical protein
MAIVYEDRKPRTDPFTYQLKAADNDSEARKNLWWKRREEGRAVLRKAGKRVSR